MRLLLIFLTIPLLAHLYSLLCFIDKMEAAVRLLPFEADQAFHAEFLVDRFLLKQG